jgi:hypothetical protein
MSVMSETKKIFRLRVRECAIREEDNFFDDNRDAKYYHLNVIKLIKDII